jgi:hypothetical protein
VLTDRNVPYQVKGLDQASMARLKAMCNELMESYHVFGSVSCLSHKYANKELYVIKRLWRLCQDERGYQDCAAPADLSFEG